MAAPRELTETGFYFARHGQTWANRLQIRAGGDCDARLTDRGRSDAHSVGRRIVRSSLPRPRMIITSPMSRTLNSARIVNTYVGVRVLVCRTLSERRLGAWNLRSYRSTAELLRLDRVPPGGEPEFVFRSRVKAAIAGNAAHWHERPLIISSRGVARVIFSEIGFRADDIANGKLYFVAVGSSALSDAVSVLEIRRDGVEEVWSAPGTRAGKALRRNR